MQGNTTTPNNNRELLIHCEVRNTKQDISERYVEQGEFALWCYLMVTRHGFQVTQIQPCIWIPEALSHKHTNLFSHAAFHEPITRFDFDSFDEISGVTDRQTRYVPTTELDQIESIFRQHLMPSEADTKLTKTAGAAISTTPAKLWTKTQPSATYCAA